MKFLVLTLFPEMFSGPLSESILKRAQEENHIEITIKNIRDFGIGKYRQVDDAPYGGGAGMVMRADVLASALRAAKKDLPEGKIVSLSPRGETLTQRKCEELADAKTPLILLCGHFEGIDERVREMFVDEEISLGDFVLTGGEIPAMALIDSIVRLLPGVVGNEESTHEESFSSDFGGRIEYPHYTRPEEFEGMKVPEVLLSGHHAEIHKWREEHLFGFTEEEFRIFQIRKKYFSPQKPWKGKRILLRKHLPEDIENWVTWMNDPDVTRYLPQEILYEWEEAEEYFYEKEQDFSGLFLTIIEKKSGQPLGKASLEREVVNTSAAKMGIYIGEKDSWGKGFGTEIIYEILRIGFELLHFEKLSLEVFQLNEAAVQMYQKCGFQISGVIKRGVKKGNTDSDLFHMEIFREEWEQQAGEK